MRAFTLIWVYCVADYLREVEDEEGEDRVIRVQGWDFKESLQQRTSLPFHLTQFLFPRFMCSYFLTVTPTGQSQRMQAVGQFVAFKNHNALKRLEMCNCANE